MRSVTRHMESVDHLAATMDPGKCAPPL